MTYLRCIVGTLTLVVSMISHAGCYEQLKMKLPSSSRGIIMFGELHGTKEIPKFFLDCVKDFILNKESVEVFLEFDVDENDNLRKYADGQIGEEEFLQSPHWKKTDGRASLAMLKLVRALKALPGGRIAAHGFDSRNPDRERAMMLNLVAQRGDKRYALVLTGNLHARLTRGVAWNADFFPFAKYLLDNGDRVISLNAHYRTGSAWICSPVCGVTELPLLGGKDNEMEGNGVVLQSDDPGYTGYFSIGAITASPPARAQ